MRKLGHRKTKSLSGHQRCGICHPSLKNRITRERQQAQRDLARETVWT
jgi:hypothetical protein